MKLALKIMLGIQVVTGALWTLAAASASGDAGFALLGLVFTLFPLYALFVLVAFVSLFTHRDQRRNAAWVIALPVVFWFLPAVVRFFAGGTLSAEKIVGMLLVLAVAALLFCIVFPGRAVAYIPDAMFRSKLFNGLIVAGLVGGWLLIVAVIVLLAGANESASAAHRSNSSMAAAYIIIGGALYLVGLGVASLLSTTWAWVGLRGGVEGSVRKLHVAQIVLSAPGILAGMAVAAWLVGEAS